jgi:capsular exopolysaccharide synthesis family protein
MSEQAFLQDARQYLAMVHKRRWVLVTCVGVSLLFAILYNYTARPVYQATAQILIDRDTPNVLPTKEIVDVAQAGGDFQTQLQLLRGRELAERVVSSIGFQKSPEVQTGPLMSPWERFQRRVLGRAPASVLDQNGLPLSPAIAAFRSRLSVGPVAGSRLVNLRFNAYDPRLAATAVNALAQAFIEQSLEYRFTTSTEATGWLTARVKEQQEKVEAAERRLQEYREKEKLVNLEERQGLIEQKLSSLNGAAISARTERITKETLYNQMRALPPQQLETFPLLMQSGKVQALRGRLVELRSQEDDLSRTLGDKHPDMVRVRGDIRETSDRLRAAIEEIVRAVETDYRTAAQQEANLQANIEASKKESLELSRMSIDYGVLKRDVDSNQQLFRELLNRTKQSGLETELRATNVRIVERAEPPRVPTIPRRTRNYELALLLGLGLGIGLALLLEHLDNTFKSPEDVKQLGLPFLGMVPDVGKGAKANVARPSPLVHKNPESAVAEAYRVLRTNLIFSSVSEQGRAVLVTSASPTEGKTTTTANLAESLAQNGSKVLIVDADLRRPTMHQNFGLPKAPGLSDLIVGKTQASQVIQATRTKGLQILTCGYIPPNPTELLGSASMREIISALREHFDWVLIDSPPVLAMADTLVLGPLVDGVILVIGAEVSTRPAVHRAIEQMAGAGVKFTGVVLNKVDLERNAYYYGQYYGEYYRSHYSQASGRPQAVAAPPPRPRVIRRS